MENASKALIMAAAVLMAIIVLSLIVFLFANFSEIKRDNTEKMNQNALETFNGKYFAYDGREDLTYYDIVNIATMAKNDNEKNGSDIWVCFVGSEYRNYALPGNYNILVKRIQDGTTVDDSDTPNPSIMKTKYEEDASTGGTQLVKVLVKYKCSVQLEQSGNSGRVKTIKFEKVNT